MAKIMNSIIIKNLIKPRFARNSYNELVNLTNAILDPGNVYETSTVNQLILNPSPASTPLHLSTFPNRFRTNYVYTKTTTQSQMNIATKTGYIIAFVFIFIVFLLGIVGRVIYSTNDTPDYLIYLKYYRASNDSNNKSNNRNKEKNEKDQNLL